MTEDDLLAKVADLSARLSILERTARVTNVSGAGGIAVESIATSEATSSTSYTNLATIGPAVTVDVTTSGSLLVVVFCESQQPSGDTHYISPALSGANTLAAADSNAAYQISTAWVTIGRLVVITGLTAGSTTVTAKYRTGAGLSNDFRNRSIAAIPL